MYVFLPFSIITMLIVENGGCEIIVRLTRLLVTCIGAFLEPEIEGDGRNGAGLVIGEKEIDGVILVHQAGGILLHSDLQFALPIHDTQHESFPYLPPLVPGRHRPPMHISFIEVFLLLLRSSVERF